MHALCTYVDIAVLTSYPNKIFGFQYLKSSQPYTRPAVCSTVRVHWWWV